MTRKEEERENRARKEEKWRVESRGRDESEREEERRERRGNETRGERTVLRIRGSQAKDLYIA